MSHSYSGRIIFAAIILQLSHSSIRCFGQTKEIEITVEDEQVQKSTGLGTVVESYHALREQHQQISERLRDLEKESPPDGEALENARDSENQIKESIEEVKKRIREVVAGADAADGPPMDQEFNLNDEFTTLAKPIVDELKDATKIARELSELRASITRQENRRKTLELSLQRIKKAGDLTEDTEILEVLDNLKDQIDGELATVRAQLATDQVRLEKRLAGQKGWASQLMDSIVDFMRGRGLILLLALFAAILTFLGLAFVHKQLFRRLGRKGKVGSSFSFRIAELLFSLFRAVATVATVVLLFLAFDDWLLITIAIILIFGLLWGAKKALVESYNKLQLLLNLGQVRQGERVTWEGLPYRVRSLGFYPLLENPSLTNSTVRITVEELGELRMRHETENEPWFVTETGHWALLSDGTYGQVTYQSPERVCLQDPGGHTKTLPTKDFLSLHPTNLSHGYALATTFGIDYSHQALDYETVADIFAAKVRLKILEHCADEEVEVVFSAFREANTSSLDYIVVAKLAGSAGDRRLPLQRALQKGCLDACNQNGWTIPFPQLTVHGSRERPSG